MSTPFTAEPSWGTTPITGTVSMSSTGKPMPVQPPQPEL
jgi:hypothetical protein